MGVSQWGHLEAGLIMESPLGILYIQTFMNEPAASPKRKIKILRIEGGISIMIFRILDI